MAFTGIGGVIFNPVGTYFITTVGWAVAYRVFALIVLVTTLPFSLFVVRSNPADKGLAPYGADGADEGAAADAKAESAPSAAAVVT